MKAYLPLFFVLGSLCPFFQGCAGNTQYTLFIDCLDFIEADQAESIAIVTSGHGLNMYLLPGVQIDIENTGPDKRSRRGLSVAAGFQDDTPKAVRLVFTVEVKIEMENLDPANVIPSGIMEVYMASGSSRNVYIDGIIFPTAATPFLVPGESGVVKIQGEMGRGDPPYEIIRSAALRMGVWLHIDPTGISDVDLRYRIKKLRVSLSGYPFGYIP